MIQRCPIMVPIIRVAFTITWDPVEVAGAVHTLENGTNLYLHGSGVAVLYDIADGLNYKLEPTYADYDGAVNLVASNISDMGGLVISQDIKWEEKGLGSSFVYLHPIDYEASSVFFRQPHSNDIRTTLVRPFTLNLWVTLLSLMLLVSVIAKRKAFLLKGSRISKVLLFALQLLISRHYIHFRLRQVPSSIAISRLIISFLGIVISSVYTAKIASIFVMRDNLIKSPADLIKNGYEINTYSWIHVTRLFQDINERQQAMKRFKYIADLSTVKDVIEGTKNGPRQTLFAHPDGFYPQALYPLKYDKELCSISTFTSTRKTPRSFYIRKDSIYREMLNRRILMFIERGINYRYHSVFKSKFQFNCHSPDTEYQQLTIRQLEIGFVLLIVGSSIAVFSLLYRLIQYHQYLDYLMPHNNAIQDFVYYR